MEYRYKLNYQAIAAKVKAARKRHCLTQAELAEKINLSTNAVAKLETNVMAASLQTLVNIANVLDLDINRLLMDERAANLETTGKDAFIESLIHSLSEKDKDFIIHIINGLKIYHNS